MRKTSLLLPAVVIVLSGILMGGCAKKTSTINDGVSIETPYSLYFSDLQGALYNSNDGKTSKVVFTSDGTPSRSIVTDGMNILWARPILYYSTNQGINFNYTYPIVTLCEDSFINVYGEPAGLNQSMMINIPSWGQTYITSRDPAGTNIFGIAGSVQGGIINSWILQDYYDTVEIYDAHTVYYTTSFTQTSSGNLIAFSQSISGTPPTPHGFMVRTSASARWIRIYPGTVSPFSSSLDSSKAWFSLGHINNRVILIDNKGTSVANGGSAAYYSDDTCHNWYPYTGLPANVPMLCIASPFEQLCYVGTEGHGLYLLNPNLNIFQPVTAGLPSNLTVRNIAFKENVYKNGTVQQYVYLATNLGIYQSADMGNNWVLTIPGNFVNIY